MTEPKKPATQELAAISRLATVTVTFNPSQMELEAQLRALPTSSIKVIVDNASQPQHWAEIEIVASNFKNVHLIRSDSNLGLAAAINRGVNWLATLTPCPEFVLLLDQDSEPQPGSITALLTAFDNLQSQDYRVGCVGPLLADPDTGLTHGFHQSSRWRWKRAYPSIGSNSPIPCSNLNGSGTLVPITLFQQLGGLDETLFIDHVDTEWAFRVMAHGYGLWGIPEAVFSHSMGQASIRFWLFGWRVWPVRSPQRHYYLYRNAAILMRRYYIPRVWKVWAVAKLLLTTGVMAMIGPSRSRQIKSMWKGIKEGSTKTGKSSITTPKINQ
ncbi:glycosyltransferase [Pseudomonas sp. UBA6323]|uniref:glycosyltransferase n=1 Tax=Pseudomonas sp. UBA6323 TaxID=1947329 RepID=UPI0025F0F610|nr:glycosyltransferase [Pseudomonas sp. UBA6323]